MFSSLSKFHHSVNTDSFFFTNLSSELFPSSDTGDFDTLHIRPSSPAPLESALVVDPAPIPTSALDTTLRRSTRIRDTPHHLTDHHCYSAIATLHEPCSYRESGTNPLWHQAMIEDVRPEKIPIF